MFFFDNALGLQLGKDIIDGFDANDRIITTQQLRDPDGDGLIRAHGTTLGFKLGELGSSLGQVKLLDESGQAIIGLEFDGSTVVDGMTYYIYSLPGGGDLLGF